MKRRDFMTASLGVGAAMAISAQPTFSLSETATGNCLPPFPKVTGLTEYVANWVMRTNYGDIPPDVIAIGKKSILDGMGLALSGSNDGTRKILEEYFKSLGLPNTGATMLGSPRRLPLRFAAFANGVAIHVEDFDDTQLAAAKDRVYGLLTHPTVPVLPAALGLAEMGGKSGKELMLAYHVGVEVECKIAEAISPRHYGDGFHSTGTCGTFGSAAACAKLRGFDAERTVRAFGIAASDAAGLRENFGTMTKSFHAGHAAEAGVFAGDLAGLGWTSAGGILEAPRGFFHAEGGTYDPAAIQNKLGQPWTFASPGVSIKPHPSGSLTHPAMGEMQRLIRENHIKAADVEEVYVGTNRNLPNALIHHRPTNALQAKFSMEFCVAILLLDGKAGLNEFTDAVVNRPDVQAMIRKVRFVEDPEADAAGFDKMTSIIRIRLTDGRSVSGRADFAKGSPANPMSFDEVADKFRGCADFAKWPRDKAEEIIAAVRNLENVRDVRTITVLCSA